MANSRYFLNVYKNEDISHKVVNPAFLKSKILEFIELIKKNQPPIPENADGDLYTGTPGIAYLCYHASTSPLMESYKKDLIARGIEYCITAEVHGTNQRKMCSTDYIGFIIGNSGVDAVAAVLHAAAGKHHKSNQYLQKFAANADYCRHSTHFGCNELFVGRAGYLLGVIWIKKTLNKSVIPQEKINEICKYIVSDGRRNAFPGSPVGYKYYGTGYFGAAHGLSSILFVLLSFNQFLTENPQDEADIKAAVDFLLSLQTPGGNYPCTSDELPYINENTNRELVHWCHGAPGIIYLMAKAYLRWKEDKYLVSCVKSADLVWEKGLLKKGPGICHGVSGSGYVFLLMFRLTADPKYLQRAIVFAEFMLTPEFRKNSRTPDCPYSLFEGLAGTICYLIDVHNPSQAVFPFMDTFYSY